MVTRLSRSRLRHCRQSPEKTADHGEADEGDCLGAACRQLAPRGACRSIIESHDGRLWATPNEPRGVIFRLTLPNGRPAQEPNWTRRRWTVPSLRAMKPWCTDGGGDFEGNAGSATKE